MSEPLDEFRDAPPSNPPTSRDRTRAFPLVRELWIALVLFLIIAIAANIVGDVIARGWMGVGNQYVVERWARVGELCARTAGLFGLLLLFFSTSLSLTSDTPLWARMLCMFASVPVIVVTGVAISRPLDALATVILVVASFLSLVAASVTALRPKETRVVGLAMSAMVASNAIRLGANGLPERWSAILHGLAWAIEGGTQVLVIIYIATRTPLRGKVLVGVGAAIVVTLLAIALTTHIDSQGTIRDAFQRGVTLRSGGHSHPFWMSRVPIVSDLAFMDGASRAVIAPSLVIEIGSFVFATLSMLAVTRSSLWPIPLLALIVLSRGQLEVPLRGLEILIAATFAILLSGRLHEDSWPPSAHSES